MTSTANINRQAGLPTLPRVTLEHYAAAVALLVQLALSHSDTSGGQAAAQVLLGTYNAHEFHLDITDLCLLDDDALTAAWTVLRGRVELREEPQEHIKNGREVFAALWKEFQHLNTGHRYAELY